MASSVEKTGTTWARRQPMETTRGSRVLRTLPGCQLRKEGRREEGGVLVFVEVEKKKKKRRKGEFFSGFFFAKKKLFKKK